MIMSLYFFYTVLHDWSKEYAVKILDNIMPALKKKDWIILNEIILLKPDTRSVVIERFCHMTNLMILIICNEWEWTIAQFCQLCSQVDKRLKIQRVFEPLKSQFKILKVELMQ